MLKIQRSLTGKKCFSPRVRCRTIGRTTFPSSESHACRSKDEAESPQRFQGDGRCARMYTNASLVACWLLAFVGILMSACLEWVWNFGPRVIFPVWLYPFPAKIPLVLGCVVLLEASRRAAAEVGIRTA